jgi:hypothetical protein
MLHVELPFWFRNRQNPFSAPSVAKVLSTGEHLIARAAGLRRAVSTSRPSIWASCRSFADELGISAAAIELAPADPNMMSTLSCSTSAGVACRGGWLQIVVKGDKLELGWGLVGDFSASSG